MKVLFIRYVLGAVALALVIDICIQLVYKIHIHQKRNRLLDRYTDHSTRESPPILLRLSGLAITIIINLLIYYFM